MRLLSAPLVMLVMLTLVTGAVAQDRGNALTLHQDIAAAHAQAVAAAETLHDDLAALVPSVPGWTSAGEAKRDDALAQWMAAIPAVTLRCAQADQSLHISLVLDPASAAVICRHIAETRRGIENGRIKPDLFRVFEGAAWHVMRAAVDIEGCVADTVAFHGRGDRTEDAIARGPAALDTFAAALMGSDPGPFLAATDALESEAALARLMGLLDAQSRQMAAILAAQARAAREVTLPSMDQLPEDLRLPRPAILLASPSAQALLEVSGCRLLLGLSAAPQALDEAQGWGRPQSKDGAIHGAFIQHNAGGILGRERTDGTGIEAVVGRSVVLRVVIPGGTPCKGDPGVVRRLFDAVVASDLSVFAPPGGQAP